MTIDKTLEEILLDAVCEDLGNPFPCNVLADYYAEQGDALREECWRLIAQKGFVPSHEPDEDTILPDLCWWWNKLNDTGSKGSHLPDFFMDGLAERGHREEFQIRKTGPIAKWYFNPHEAYSCFVQRFLTLTEKERQELWK